MSETDPDAARKRRMAVSACVPADAVEARPVEVRPPPAHVPLRGPQAIRRTRQEAAGGAG